MGEVIAPIQFADAQVFHARLRPRGLTFRYSVLALHVDIDRLTENTRIALFSVGRFDLFGFDPRDHGPRDGSALRPYIDRLHTGAGLEPPQRVTLVCFPRILGFVFNPISIYIGTDAAGCATSVVYEVRNTFGQHHSYVMHLDRLADGGVAPHECDKLFYVSPFMDMALRYRFRLSPPEGGRFALTIIERDSQGTVLTALLRTTAFEARTSALLRRVARTPLLGLKVLAAIHWQALRLWMAGHTVRPRPAPPAAVSRDLPGDFTLSQMPPQPEASHV